MLRQPDDVAKAGSSLACAPALVATWHAHLDLQSLCLQAPSALVTLLFTVTGKMQPMRGEGCFGFQCEDGSAWVSGKHVVQSGSRRQGWKREAAYSHVQRTENIEKTGSETGL